MMLLLLLVALLLLISLMLLSRIALLLLTLLMPGTILRLTTQRVGGVVVWLSMLRLIVLSRAAISSRRSGFASSEINVHSSFIVLSMVLQTLLLADLLNTRLDFLDVVDRMIALSNNAESDMRGDQEKQTL